MADEHAGDSDERPGSPTEIVIEFPLPSEFRCPKCAGPRKGRGAYIYSSHGGLAKHIKFDHPGEYVLVFQCGVCGYRGGTAYPAKDVRTHHAKNHVVNRPALSTETRARGRTGSDRTANSSSNSTITALRSSARARVSSDNSLISSRVTPDRSNGPSPGNPPPRTTRRPPSLSSQRDDTGATISRPSGRTITTRVTASTTSSTTKGPPTTSRGTHNKTPTQPRASHAATPSTRNSRAQSTPPTSMLHRKQTAPLRPRDSNRLVTVITTTAAGPVTRSRRLMSLPPETRDVLQKRKGLTRANTESTNSSPRESRDTPITLAPQPRMPSEPSQPSPHSPTDGNNEGSEHPPSTGAAYLPPTTSITTLTTVTTSVSTCGRPIVTARLIGEGPRIVSATRVNPTANQHLLSRIQEERCTHQMEVQRPSTSHGTTEGRESGRLSEVALRKGRGGGRRLGSSSSSSSSSSSHSVGAQSDDSVSTRNPVTHSPMNNNLNNRNDNVIDVNNDSHRSPQLEALQNPVRQAPPAFAPSFSASVPRDHSLRNPQTAHTEPNIFPRSSTASQLPKSGSAGASASGGAPSGGLARSGLASRQTQRNHGTINRGNNPATSSTSAQRTRPHHFQPADRMSRAPARAPTATNSQRATREQGAGRISEAANTRRRLVARAEGINTVDGLDQLAVDLASFLQAKSGKPANNQPRPPRAQPQQREPPSQQPRHDRAGYHPDDANDRRSRHQGAEPMFHQGAQQVRQATEIQKLYRTNRKRAMQKILVGSTKHCQVQRDEVYQHYHSMYSLARNSMGNEPESQWPEWPENGNERLVEALTKPFDALEVNKRLRKAHNSAPGPDGLTYRELRRADPGAVVITAAFNACLRLSAFPTSWKMSNTVVVYKKGDQADLSNWRPLAMGDTTAKLFAAVLADRITEFAVRGKRLGQEQKGFLQYEGCAEHNYVLQEVIEDSKRTGKELLVAWLDLTNAFGSIPHESIYRALDGAGLPSSSVNMVRAMYTDCTTQVRTREGFTDPIRIAAGVKQGCPASPITFNLTLESLIRELSSKGTGYVMGTTRWKNLAYADDLALIAGSPEEMRLLLTTAEAEAKKIGLRFNPGKCATLHLRGKGGKQRAVPTEFIMDDEPVKALQAGQAYQHLGIPTGYKVRQTPVATIEQLITDVRTVDDSLLTPWQKFDAVATFILPRLDFVMRGAQVRKAGLTAADKAIKRAGKRWLNLPQRASPEVVFIPPYRGGGGLPPLADLADVLTVAHAFRMLTCADGSVSALARETLSDTVQRKLKRPPVQQDIAEYLSGSLEGEFFGPSTDNSSFWSRVRVATRRQAAKLELKWRHDGGRDELSLECKSSRGRTVIIPPEARTQVINRLRTAIQEHYLATLLAKPDQGKVYEVSSGVRVANHFMRSGSYTRFAEWRFVHRARLDVLPLNGARRWGEGDKRCRRCNHALESLPHVLCHCTPHSAARQLRHDAIVARVAKAVKLPGTMTINQTVAGVSGGNLSALRPDIVIRNETTRSVTIVDITVPFENRRESFAEARNEKIRKYTPLAAALHSRGYNVEVKAILVGALGTWDPRNEPVLRRLRVNQRYASMMRRLVVSDTIHWSRDIYVEHVSGVRQYSAPPGERPGGRTSNPPDPT